LIFITAYFNKRAPVLLLYKMHDPSALPSNDEMPRVQMVEQIAANSACPDRNSPPVLRSCCRCKEKRKE
jgi:hypothetical protein